MQNPEHALKWSCQLLLFALLPLSASGGNLEIESFVTHPSCFGLNDGAIEVFPINGEAPYSFTWTHAGAEIGTEELLVNLAPGVYEVNILDATGNCGGTFEFLLDEPTGFDIQLAADPVQVPLGEATQLQVLGGQDFPQGTNFFWSVTEGLSCTNCANPIFVPADNMVVSVTVVPPNGCSITVSTELRVQKSREVYIPNIFTPNGDGINDYFRLYPGNGVQEIRMMRLYNRFGELLYEAANPELGWDGRFRGTPLPGGVYTYQIEVLFWDRLTEVFTGDVILIH